MTTVQILLFLVVALGLCAGVTAVLIARALEPHGVRTPFPFLGLFIFRNLHRYSEITRRTGGKIGPLFYAYAVPINAALVLLVVAALIGLAR
jgi:hypothetical protein